MSDYNDGDLLEAATGDMFVRGRVAKLGTRLDIGAGDLNWGMDIHSMKRVGFTLTVIEKAVPKVVLPSEAGVYRCSEGDLWWVTRNGHGDLEYRFEGKFIRTDFAIQNAPFTKLEPVSETAKKVLDAVRHNAEKSRSHEFNGKPIYDITEVDLEGIGEEFGVTS